MAEYLVERKSTSQQLSNGAVMQLDFTPLNSGPIHILAIVRPMMGPVNCQLALCPPGSNTPVIRRTHTGGGAASLDYTPAPSSVGPGKRWSVRLTNQNGRTTWFALTAMFTGDKELTTVTVPSKVIDTVLNGTLGPGRVHVTDGANASSISFPSTFGVGPYTFTVPRFSKKIDLPFPIPDITVTERVEDFNSSDIVCTLVNGNAQFPNGSVMVEIPFEEGGTEIHGTFHAELKRPVLRVQLGIEVRDGMISYSTSNIVTDFSCGVDVSNAPGWLETIIRQFYDYVDAVRHAVEAGVRNALADAQLRKSFAEKLNRSLPAALRNVVIVSAKVAGGVLSVKYYRN